MTEGFKLNERVKILRGGLDAFPQVSLTNVVGRVCSTHPTAGPGMVSVWVFWDKTRYAHIKGLPNIINNYPADLEKIEVEKPRPAMQLV